MATKSGILGLIIGVATVLIIVSAVGENTDSQVSEIGIVEESGFSQSCAETDCYTPSVLTIKSGTVVTMTNTDEDGALPQPLKKLSRITTKYSPFISCSSLLSLNS